LFKDANRNIATILIELIDIIATIITESLINFRHPL
jgi:hypothetical protein